MRVISCMLLVGFLCGAGAGCSLFKKNTNSPAGPSPLGPAPAKFPGADDPLLNSNINGIPTPPPLPPAGGVNQPIAPVGHGFSTLAGTVMDSSYRPIPGAYVRWISLDEKDKGAPIDVAANASGHFIIVGVRPGAPYKLIARTKQGDKLLAGTTLTTAPNTRVAIVVREDLGNGGTPPLPAAPVPPAQETSKNGDASKPTKPAPKMPWDGLFGQNKKPATEPNLPATLNVTAPSAPAAKTPPAREPTFVPGITDLAKDRPPLLSIPQKMPNRPAGDSKLDTGPTRFPSCVLVGNHLENLAVKDSKGQNWEYKKHAAGKLILLDFWSTHCFYCRDSMPALNRFQKQYGSRGLEVIGVALEEGKDVKKDADAVNKYCASLQLGYRQLMGRSGTFDAAKHFRVEGMPTLMLISEQGDIIWQHTGRPDAALLNALERTIQTRLGGGGL